MDNIKQSINDLTNHKEFLKLCMIIFDALEKNKAELLSNQSTLNQTANTQKNVLTALSRIQIDSNDLQELIANFKSDIDNNNEIIISKMYNNMNLIIEKFNTSMNSINFDTIKIKIEDNIVDIFHNKIFTSFEDTKNQFNYSIVQLRDLRDKIIKSTNEIDSSINVFISNNDKFMNDSAQVFSRIKKFKYFAAVTIFIAGMSFGVIGSYHHDNEFFEDKENFFKFKYNAEAKKLKDKRQHLDLQYINSTKIAKYLKTSSAQITHLNNENGELIVEQAIAFKKTEVNLSENDDYFFIELKKPFSFK